MRQKQDDVMIKENTSNKFDGFCQINIGMYDGPSA